MYKNGSIYVLNCLFDPRYSQQLVESSARCLKVHSQGACCWWTPTVTKSEVTKQSLSTNMGKLHLNDLFILKLILIISTLPTIYFKKTPT